jgi:glutamyl-Q tRNA(Asp) synthetase
MVLEIKKTNYRGRFAPSPTGPLHEGSLAAAVASFLQARAQGGTWLVRMENLDPPRETKGAVDNILQTLEAFGLWWDETVVYQNKRLTLYEDALVELQRAGFVYACTCTRKEIADSNLRGIEGPVYPGTCQTKRNNTQAQHAWRVLTNRSTISFDDLWQGRVERELEKAYGDFVVKRADGFFAYQLASAVDDAEQKITEVVRGADLIDSTPRQIHLQRLLNLPTPRYAHHPVAVNAQGEKLSKQTYAPAVDAKNPLPALVRALTFLGQSPPTDLREGDLKTFWGWAIGNWKPQNVSSIRSIAVSGK